MLAGSSRLVIRERRFVNAGSEQVRELLRHYGATEIEPLRLVALVRAKKPQLLERLDPLRDHAQLEALRHADHGGDDAGILARRRDLGDERLIDLERVDRKFLEIAQARIARAEVVDRDLDADVSDGVEDRRDGVGMSHE